MRFGLPIGFGLAVAIVAAVLAVGASAAPGGVALLSVRGSDYGPVLFGADGKVVYVFEADHSSKSTCYGACARAWPPLLTTGAPAGGPGIRAKLLVTTTRSDGTVQVTYNGHPLYYDGMSSDSMPGEIGCQHLNIHGGVWLIVKPNGQPNMAKSTAHG